MAAVHIGTLLLANKASSLARSCFSSFLLASRRFVSTRPSDHPPAADFLLGLNLLSNLLNTNLGIGERAKPSRRRQKAKPVWCRRSSCVRRGRNRGIALNNSATRSHFLPFGQVPCLLQNKAGGVWWFSSLDVILALSSSIISPSDNIHDSRTQPSAPPRPLHTPSLCKEIPSRCSTP